MGKRRFRGVVNAPQSVTEASRLSNEGITTENNGWDSGVKVRSYIDQSGKDRFDIYATGGSNGELRAEFFGQVFRVGGTLCFEPYGKKAQALN